MGTSDKKLTSQDVVKAHIKVDDKKQFVQNCYKEGKSEAQKIRELIKDYNAKQ
jgi:hypothetical protein